MVSSSSLAPSTSTFPSRSSQSFWARSFTLSRLSPSAISSVRFFRACSTLRSEVAIRIVTVRSSAGTLKR